VVEDLHVQEERLQGCGLRPGEEILGQVVGSLCSKNVHVEYLIANLFLKFSVFLPIL
jgi:hypothetical protein